MRNKLIAGAVGMIVLIGAITYAMAPPWARISRRWAETTGQSATIYVGVGNTVRAYHSLGKVVSESGSDGFYFKDRASGRLVEVSNNIVIEY